MVEISHIEFRRHVHFKKRLQTAIDHFKLVMTIISHHRFWVHHNDPLCTYYTYMAIYQTLG